MERLRNRYAKKWHALFQALLYNSIYCIHFNIKSINIQVVLKILTKKKTHPYEWERYFFFWHRLDEGNCTNTVQVFMNLFFGNCSTSEILNGFLELGHISTTAVIPQHVYLRTINPHTIKVQDVQACHRICLQHFHHARQCTRIAFRHRDQHFLHVHACRNSFVCHSFPPCVITLLLLTFLMM